MPNFVFCLIFCFFDKKPIVFEKITKNMANQLYVNEILLHRRSHTSLIGAMRPRGPVRTYYVARLSHTTSSGMTSPRLTVLRRYVAVLVAPISVAQLGQDLLSQLDPWCDWAGVTPRMCTSHARQSGATCAILAVLTALQP
jgi:hypothetical protein